MSIFQYLTYAEAEADIPNIEENDIVLVAHDETNANKYTPYVVDSGALVRDADNFNGFSEYVSTSLTARDPKILARIAVPVMQGPDVTEKEPDFTFGMVKSLFASPPGSANETYATISTFWGFNLGPDGTPEDVTKPAFGLFLEQRYIQEGVTANEVQLRSYTPEPTVPNGWIEHRPMQFFLPGEGSDGALQAVQFAAGRFRIYDENGVPILVGDVHDRAFEMADGAFLRFDENNYPVLRQRNSSGEEKPLPYLNARNEFQVEAPIHHVTGPQTNASGHSSYVYRILESPVEDGYYEEVFLGAGVGGSFIANFFQGSVSGNILRQTVNLHATGGIYEQRTTTAGDIGNTYSVGPVSWVWGAKGSDKCFYFSPSGYLHISYAFKLDPVTLDMTFGGDACLPPGKVVKVNGQQVVGARQPLIPDPSGGDTQDAQSRTAIASILDLLAAHGLMAPS